MKPGYQTTEFWIHLIPQLLSGYGFISGMIPPQWAAAVSVVGAGLYGIARGLAKLGFLGGTAGAVLKSLPEKPVNGA